MAGIGFELRRLVDRGDYTGVALGYGLAGVLGAGPWILSTAGILLVSLLAFGAPERGETIPRFLVSVTYLMAGSLVLTGCLQFLFTRFVADRVYEGRLGVVLPNLLGALALTSLAAGLCGAGVLSLFADASLAYRALMLASFVVLCDIWVAVVFVSSVKAFRLILGVFLAGYAATTGAAVALSPFGLEGLLTGFLAGHALLFFLLLGVIARRYPGERLVAFDFLRRGQAFYLLALTGVVFNLGMWADRLLFWFAHDGARICVGPLRFSPIYDMPVFVASLSVIPGMAVFLLRIEADFAATWERFYDAIRGGRPLAEIESAKDDMVRAIRHGLLEIVKVQGLLVVALVLAAPRLLAALGLSPHSVPLFRVAVVGFGIVVLMLAILNVLFYLDKRFLSFAGACIFLGANGALTLATQGLGPAWYGYGFTLAAALTVVAGLAALSRTLDRHEFETFMLQ